VSIILALLRKDPRSKWHLMRRIYEGQFTHLDAVTFCGRDVDRGKTGSQSHDMSPEQAWARKDLCEHCRLLAYKAVLQGWKPGSIE